MTLILPQLVQLGITVKFALVLRGRVGEFQHLLVYELALAVANVEVQQWQVIDHLGRRRFRRLHIFTTLIVESEIFMGHLAGHGGGLGYCRLLKQCLGGGEIRVWRLQWCLHHVMIVAVVIVNSCRWPVRKSLDADLCRRCLILLVLVDDLGLSLANEHSRPHHLCTFHCAERPRTTFLLDRRVFPNLTEPQSFIRRVLRLVVI